MISEALRGHVGFVWSVAFSPDGKRIVSGSDDKTVRVWDGPEAWPEIVCGKLTRNMSKKVWKQYMGDIPYEVQCPGLPVPE